MRENPDNVVDIGEVRARRDAQRDSFCQHRRLVYNTQNEAIWCEDCGSVIGAFAAFRRLVEQMQAARDRLRQEREEIDHAWRVVIHTQAAKAIEKAWRSRMMVPACPYCSMGIFPEDGLGESLINRETAARQRDLYITRVQKQHKHTPLRPLLQGDEG